MDDEDRRLSDNAILQQATDNVTQHLQYALTQDVTGQVYWRTLTQTFVRVSCLCNIPSVW